MFKAVKLKNNTYLDSSSIVHNRELLSDLLNQKCVRLGEVGNSNDTVNLQNDKLSNYKYLLVVSGWGYNKASTIISTHVFVNSPGFSFCRQYVPIYGGNDFTWITSINDTSFGIHGAVGTDTVTTVYGIK